MYFGSPEHAAETTKGRHAEIADGLQWLTFAHLPQALQIFSAPFYAAAVEMIERITTDSPELKMALNKLTEAKDAAVRAGIRHDTGRAGSVPRPQEVSEPPTLSEPPEQASAGTPVPMQPGETYMDYLKRISSPKATGF